jgi:hypothetical protein
MHLEIFLWIFFLFMSLDWQRSREPPSQKVEALSLCFVLHLKK